MRLDYKNKNFELVIFELVSLKPVGAPVFLFVYF